MRKYLPNGQEVKVIEHLTSGSYLVCRVFECTLVPDECVEIVDDEYPFIADKVFDEPPVAKIAETITELQRQEATLRKSIQTLHQELRDIVTDKYDRLNRCTSQEDVLEILQEYLLKQDRENPREEIIEVAQKYELALPDGYLAAYQKAQKTYFEVKRWQKEIEQLKA